MKEYERVYAQIDLDAIIDNIEAMDALIPKETKIMAVIKTDGYGHGAVAIAKALQDKPYMYGFATATAEEALILRHVGIKLPILILGYVFPYSYERLIEKEVSFTIFNDKMIEELSEVSEKVHKKVKAHIKVDTGMGRIGVFPNDDGASFVKRVLTHPNVVTEGIFTHFAKADEKNLDSANHQAEVFEKFVQRVEQENHVRIPIHHCSNSAAIIAMKNCSMDVVRAGIAMYGIKPSEEMAECNINLKPALSLKSKIVFIKQVPKGTPISYGHTYVSKTEERIATIPVGYGDGYPRGLSNCGYVLIHGKKAPIVGRICMDQFMVNISEIPEANEGDSVVLIGKDGEYELMVEELCKIYGGFHYEFLCDLSKRIPRIYIHNGIEEYQKDYYEDYR